MKILTIFIIIFLTFQTGYCQSVCVRDPLLEKELYKYLVSRINQYRVNIFGQDKLDTKNYKGMCIISINLTTDSILNEKPKIGIYSAQFACEDCGNRPEIFIQSATKREFVNLDKNGLNEDGVMKKIEDFFQIYADKFNDLEKTRTIKKVRNVLLDRRS